MVSFSALSWVGHGTVAEGRGKRRRPCWAWALPGHPPPRAPPEKWRIGRRGSRVSPCRFLCWEGGLAGLPEHLLYNVPMEHPHIQTARVDPATPGLGHGGTMRTHIEVSPVTGLAAGTGGTRNVCPCIVHPSRPRAQPSVGITSPSSVHTGGQPVRAGH